MAAHDDLLKIIASGTPWLKSSSWIEGGAYGAKSPSKALIEAIQGTYFLLKMLQRCITEGTLEHHIYNDSFGDFPPEKITIVSLKMTLDLMLENYNCCTSECDFLIDFVDHDKRQEYIDEKEQEELHKTILLNLMNNSLNANS